MKKTISIIAVVALLLIGAFWLLNNMSNQVTIKQKTTMLSAQIKSVGGQIIDVREPSEYEAGHADGAINIPLGNILKADFSEVDKNKPIYVYCRTGKRASQAKIAFEQAGYNNVTNIGGLTDWQSQGNKVCSANAPSC
ncbi:MAG: phage shock protein [Patescibacteria group bacterium]|nr:phage shock protein [Patescibacteria group bacterium]